MNKVLKIGMMTALSGFLLIGCSGTPDAPDTKHSQSSNEISSVEAHAAILHKHLTQEKLSTIVRRVGEDAGWKMTEFKSNTFIAEKMSKDGMVSVTIEFSNHSIDIEPENNDLKDAINKALGR